MRTRRRRLRALAAVAAVALSAAGCGSTQPYADTPVPRATATSAPPTSSGGGSTAPACANALASYQPAGALPAAGAMPTGSKMHEIQQRGRLIAGVSADTLLLGSRNPVSGRIEGFDIDVLKQVSQAIFGRDNAIELRVITSAQRIPVLEQGSVDIVARNMTINCARWEQIAFSTEYYRSGQKVLVPLNSAAKRIEDLKGQRVCAPAATTTLDNLLKIEGVKAVTASTHTGCLVMFQQGQADAITGDDTVLAGLSAQDPYAKVVGPAFTQEPYGLGIAKDDVDLVRFVNGVLAQMRTDGRWKAIYNRWLAADLGPAPAPPAAVYGRTP